MLTTKALLVTATIAVPTTAPVHPEYVAPTKPVAVKTTYVKPKTTVKKWVRITPYEKPTVAQVHFIIAHEAKKWGISQASLSHRIRCESTYRWYAGNGQYIGLAQFGANAFARSVASIGTRKVKYVKKKKVTKYILKKTKYSNGSVKTSKLRKIKQYRIYIFEGALPLNPPRHHGWFQVRAVARAMAGLGTVSNGEWDPKCQ